MTWPVPMNLVSGKTQRETSQLEARAGLRDTIGLGHAEFRKHMGKWKGKKKSVSLGIQMPNYLKFVHLKKCC